LPVITAVLAATAAFTAWGAHHMREFAVVIRRRRLVERLRPVSGSRHTFGGVRAFFTPVIMTACWRNGSH
jgi:uncharacterized protein YndB with AHSA1/START domain